MEYVGIVIILSLLQYFYFAACVAGLRQKVGTPATETAEDQTLKRTIRVHANTGEMIIIFLPLIVLCGHFLNGKIAAGIGVFWIVARFLYQHGYLKDGKSRVQGFLLADLVFLLLMLGALYGIVHSLLA